MNTSPKFLVTMTATILVLSGIILLFNITAAAATTGTFTEWDAVARLDAAGNPTPVRDFDPHIADLDRTGNTGFSANTPWYTIDNRSPSNPCALGHLEPGTNTLISWGIGSGVPVGVDVDDASGRVWWTVSGRIRADDSPFTVIPNTHVAFKAPGAASDSFTHFGGTSNGAGITVDSAGNAYYAEIGTSPDRITKIDPLTGDLKSWPLSGNPAPRYLVFNSDDTKLYFTTALSRTINELTIATGDLKTWKYPTVAAGDSDIFNTNGIFRQSDEAIWYADTRGDLVARLNPSTDVITEFTKAGMENPQYLVVSKANQVFITERRGNTVDVMEIEGGTDTKVAPSKSKLVPTTDDTNKPNTFDRDRLSRVIIPTVTDVEGIDPVSIERFPLPTARSDPIGITDVVQTAVGGGETKFGIFGDEFGGRAPDQIFLFESSLIIPAKIEKNLLEGPDEIGIYLLEPTRYVYEIAYTGPAALVIDFVPAEFDITGLDASDGSDATSARVSKGKGDSAEKIEWKVPDGSSTLTVTIQTVESKSKGKVDGQRVDVFKPTSCGPLPINKGATPFEVDEDGNLVLDPPVTGVPIPLTEPSNSLGVEAIEGTKLCCLTDKDCNDNNLCTDDVCNAQNRCEITAIDPTDNNVCTDDSCDPATGPVNTPNDASCDDSNACTTADTCSGGTCVGGSKLVCGVGSECVAVFCDSDTGCGKKLLDGIPCGERGAGVCSEGVCELPRDLAVLCSCGGSEIAFCTGTCDLDPIRFCFERSCTPIGFCGPDPRCGNG